jgi:hypothetical protein
MPPAVAPLVPSLLTALASVPDDSNAGAISYGGGRIAWRRSHKRSGIKRLRTHLIRYSLGQAMARAAGIDPA